ncbi:protein NUCLEOLAR COMPLEX ASSOCIATED 4-like isoform X1 [Actinidia eriantha]|uniref:protein NUCLEOLAR COMPLEX ASSOCIATED 4-like isoform X1 n=1 Tax=Actinidia eriantha TaxID=165200 RepID=UPI00258DB873|nr:protein NUCLEOLAR COMPLEX ASSOCIATED 4-like isoform X1 [Actinidia eriantha]
MDSILSKKKKNKKREKYRLSDLKTLGMELLSSRAKINNLPLLLTFVSPASRPQYALEALLSLQAFFTPLLPQLSPSSSSTNTNGTAQDDPDSIYCIWLRSKFDELVNSLIDVSVSPQSEEGLREVVLDTIMEFVKVGNGGRFHSAIYHRLLRSIVHSKLGIDVLLDFLAAKYFKYIDVRYFTYIAVDKLARTLDPKNISDNKIVSGDNSHSRTSVELSIHKIYYILSHIPSLESMDEKADYEMWNGLGVFIKDADRKKHSELQKAEDKQRKIDKSSNNVLSAANISKKNKIKFTKAWTSFLRLPLPLNVYKEVLVTLHQAVIPRFSNPILLCDFLTRSYDIGGVISVMALSSLYILMTQHGLEYPNFYEKLYALLVPSIFMAKHRGKFFELLDSCLKSPLLPAYLAAAFTKKLSRLSLSVPPSGGLVIIVLIHNLLRRHPSINCLVHREDGGGISGEHSREGKDGESEDSCTSTEMSSKERGIDHFNNEEISPVKTNAMRSSLWEIDTVRHHYCPPVSRFVLSLENDLTVRRKTTELAVDDFSSGSYATIFREEIRRRVKQVPLAFYKATPTSLFSESDFPGWSFKFKENDESVATNVDNGNIDKSEDHDHGFAKRQRIECL